MTSIHLSSQNVILSSRTLPCHPKTLSCHPEMTPLSSRNVILSSRTFPCHPEMLSCHPERSEGSKSKASRSKSSIASCTKKPYHCIILFYSYNYALFKSSESELKSNKVLDNEGVDVYVIPEFKQMAK